MLKRLVTKVVGTRFQRELKRIQPLVDAIHGHETRLKDLSDAELQAQTPTFRARIAERTGALAAEVERLRRGKQQRPPGGVRGGRLPSAGHGDAARGTAGVR